MKNVSMANCCMMRMQIQLPNALYEEAQRVAREREMSLSEVVCRGVEYITRANPPVGSGKPWRPPAPSDLGPLRAPQEDWRLIVNDPAPPRP